MSKEISNSIAGCSEMQTEGKVPSFDEAELKRKFLLKECSVVIHPIIVNGNDPIPKTEIRPVSEDMSQSTPNVSTENELQTSKSEHSVMNSCQKSKTKPHPKGKNPNKVARLREEAHDENTTNSENSDDFTLEINWEENLECDSKLVDEFAPRVLGAKSTSNLENSVDEIVDNKPATMEPVPSSLADCEPLDEGSEIFVRFKTEWLAASVSEMDHEEGELLVKYCQGDPPPPMEWLNLTSNRISRFRPPPQPQPVDIVQPSEPDSPPNENPDEKKEDVMSSVSQEAESVKTYPPAGQMAPPRRPPPSPVARPRSPPHHHQRPSRPVVGHPKQRGLRKGKPGPAHQPQRHHVSKFAEGEKVLAKWSDYRLQKFPAIIKKIVPGGMYDVLFYDGFEKTISEEHIFKTTEEEVAKYENMTPSEADSFSHMDLDSKEARRERKRKTFDDYVFAQALKVSKKKSPFSGGGGHHRERKIRYYEEGEGQTESGEGLHKRMKRRKRPMFSAKRDSRLKLHLYDLQRPPPGSLPPLAPTAAPVPPPPQTSSGFSPPIHRDSSSPLSQPQPTESEEFPGFDIDPVNETEGCAEEKPPVSLPPPPPESSPAVVKIEPPEPVVVKTEKETIPERWKPHENVNYKPIDITRDGVVRKSLVVPDNYLPRGWSKHAVVSTTNNLWDVILLSPDGYQITTMKELEQYFEMLGTGGPPPPTLDFHADFNVLAELAMKQKELTSASAVSAPSTPRAWFKKGGNRTPGRLPPGGGVTKRGGRRGGRGPHHLGPGRGGSPGVRTLLPKYRFPHASPPILTPKTTTPESEFRCPKEGCDKKFRKESLLQMHIKHYHRELSSLGRRAPNMVDLACARSESVNSDWSPTDFPKVPLVPTKKIHPRPSVGEDLSRPEHLQEALSPLQGSSRLPDRGSSDGPSSKHHLQEERRSTIKTMLPLRSDSHLKSHVDSDNVESDDDFLEHKKNGSRIFKAGKFRRGGKFPTETETEEEKPMVSEDGVIIERLKSEEFINCVCGFREEDGLMIQCDICMCWQHGICSGIETEAEVPDRYVCSICRNPLRVRSSKKYIYAQHYLTQGKLPTFNFRTRNEDEIAHKENILKRCSELTSSLLEIKRVDKSLTAKLNIAEKPNHPKLYMWAKNWDEVSKCNMKLQKDQQHGSNGDIKPGVGPQPEAPIDLEECRIRLLDHVEHNYSLIEDRLLSLQTQIAALESLDPDLTSNSCTDKATKQTIQMLIRDLETLNKLSAIS